MRRNVSPFMSSYSQDYFISFINFQLTKHCWNLPSDLHSNISIIHTVVFLFRRVCIFVISVRLSDRLFVSIISASIGQKSVKFDIGSFMKTFREILAVFLIGQKYRTFTWRPKSFLLLSATLNHQKTLSSSEMASGCNCSSGDVNNSKRFISASVPQRKHFSVHMAQRWIFGSSMCRFTIQRKMLSFHGNNI